MLTRRTLLRGLGGLISSGLAFGAYAFGVEPILRLQIARYALTPPGWPPGLRLRIVALSDFHACDPWMPISRVQALVDRANALDGDLTLLLGDYISGASMPRWDIDPDRLAQALARLASPLGTFAILGNHDWWRDREGVRERRGPTFMHRALERAGVDVLENDVRRLAHGGRHVWLAGLGDQIAFGEGRRRRDRGVDDLPGTLARIADEAPVILLVHEPDIFPVVPSRVALTLSSHTHGGQVNLLGWRPAAASDLSDRYFRGHFRERDRDLIVTSGLGCSILPVRVGVPPEILVVELGEGARA